MIAEVTWFYHWGPRDAGALTWTELREWFEQAQRIANMQTQRG
ncbi:GpE family phage tail protein [Paraburkholderia sp. EG304]